MNRSCYVSHPPVSCSATDGEKRQREGKSERGRALSMRHVSHAAWRLCMIPKTSPLQRGRAHFHWHRHHSDLFFNHLNQRWRSAESGNFSECQNSVLICLWGSEEVQPGPQCHSRPRQQNSMNKTPGMRITSSCPFTLTAVPTLWLEETQRG